MAVRDYSEEIPQKKELDKLSRLNKKFQQIKSFIVVSTGLLTVFSLVYSYLVFFFTNKKISESKLTAMILDFQETLPANIFMILIAVGIGFLIAGIYKVNK